jgi:hypothetical protein
VLGGFLCIARLAAMLGDQSGGQGKANCGYVRLNRGGRVAEVGWRRSGMDGESRLVDTEVELCLWYRDLVKKQTFSAKSI